MMMILIIGFTRPPTIHFEFITKCDKRYYKLGQVYKVQQLLQSATPSVFREFFQARVLQSNGMTQGAFFGENPNSDFRIQKRILRFGGANPKTGHQSIKSTLRVDSLDQIQIRIFEIHNLSFFGGKDFKKVLLTGVFSKKKKVRDRCHTGMTFYLNLCWWRLINFEPLVTYHSMFVIYSTYQQTVFKPLLFMFFVRMQRLLTPVYFPSKLKKTIHRLQL